MDNIPQLREDLADAKLPVAIRLELRIPPDADVLRVSLGGEFIQKTFGSQWAGYTVEQWGIEVKPETWPPPWPWQRLGGPLVIQTRLLRIYSDDSPAYTEFRWDPTNGKRIGIHGLEGVHREGDVRPAIKSLKLITKLTNQGRPPGALSVPHDMAMKQARKAKQLKDKGLSYAQVGAHLGLSENTVKQRIKLLQQ